MSSSTDPFVAWQGETAGRTYRVVINPQVLPTSEFRVIVEVGVLDGMGTVSWHRAIGEQRDFVLRCAIDQLAR